MSWPFNKNREPLGEDGPSGGMMCRCGHVHMDHSWQWVERDGMNSRGLMCNAQRCLCEHFFDAKLVLDRYGEECWNDQDGADTADYADVWLREYGKHRHGLEPA